MSDLRGLTPGMFGLTQIRGPVGLFIRLGQVCVGDASRYTHAFIVLDDETVLEAQPWGATISPLSKFDDGRTVAASWAIRLTPAERAEVVRVARDFVGARYGFSAYAHLTLATFGINHPRLTAYLAVNRRLICSQLVDQIYFLAGVHLFDDGRAHFDVTPGDLANRLIERDWSQR